MKKYKVFLKGFLLFLLSQFVAILGTYLWLEFDKTDYGMGGGVLIWLVYFGLSVFISVVGVITIIISDKINWKKYLLIIPELVVLQMIMMQLLLLAMTLFFGYMEYKQTGDTSIIILD